MNTTTIFARFTIYCDLLVSGATDKELTDYLFRTEIKTMGLTRFWMRRHLKPVVARLRKIDLSL